MTGIVAADLAGRIVEANAAYLALAGCTLAELRGRGALLLTDADDRERSRGEIEALVSGAVDEVSAATRRYTREDGSAVRVAVQLTLLRGPDGNPQSIIGIFQEVARATERGGARVTADTPPQGGDALYRHLVEGARDYAMLMLSPAGVVTYANPGAEAIFRYSAGELIGRRGAEIFPPEERSRGAFEHELAVAAETGHAGDDRWLLRKDGTRFWAAGAVMRLADGQGQVIGFAKVLQDATPRKRAEDALAVSESHLRALFETLDLGVAYQGFSGEAIEINPAGERILGLSGEQMRAQGRDAYDALWLSGFDKNHAAPPAEQSPLVAMRSGEAARGQIVSFWNPRLGETRWLRINSSAPLAPGESGARMVYTVFEDITEQRRADARQQMLLDAGTLLSASLEYDDTLDTIAAVTVPVLADYCFLDLQLDDGRVERVARAGQDAALLERYDAATRVAGPLEEGRHPIMDVLRTGVPAYLPELSDTWLNPPPTTPDGQVPASAPAVASVIVVPLPMKERQSGALTLCRAGGERRHTPADFSSARELAAQSSLALESARLYLVSQREIEARIALEAEQERLLVETRERADRENLINRISAAMRTTLNPELVCARAAALLGEALGADRCYYGVFDLPQKLLRVFDDWRRPDLSSVQGDYVGDHIPSLYDELYGRALLAVVSDVTATEASEALRSLTSDVGIRAFVSSALPRDASAPAPMLTVAMSDAAREWTPAEIELIEVVAVMIRTVVEAARVQQRERNIATQLQNALQPDVVTKAPGLALGVHYEAALAEAAVGGDFYDIYPIDTGCTALVVGDMSGKGLAAAAQVAMVRNMLRATLYTGATVAGAVTALNQILARNELLIGFATLFVSVYDSARSSLLYVNCGQDPALVWHAATGEVELLTPTGTVIGPFEDAEFTAARVALAPGDCVAIFTDGMTEAGPNRREMLGIEGMASLLREAATRPAAAAASGPPDAGAVLRDLIAGAERFAQGATRDDICVVVGVATPAG